MSRGHARGLVLGAMALGAVLQRPTSASAQGTQPDIYGVGQYPAVPPASPTCPTTVLLGGHFHSRALGTAHLTWTFADGGVVHNSMRITNIGEDGYRETVAVPRPRNTKVVLTVVGPDGNSGSAAAIPFNVQCSLPPAVLRHAPVIASVLGPRPQLTRQLLGSYPGSLELSTNGTTFGTEAAVTQPIGLGGAPPSPSLRVPVTLRWHPVVRPLPTANPNGQGTITGINGYVVLQAAQGRGPFGPVVWDSVAFARSSPVLVPIALSPRGSAWLRVAVLYQGVVDQYVNTGVDSPVLMPVTMHWVADSTNVVRIIPR